MWSLHQANQPAGHILHVTPISVISCHVMPCLRYIISKYSITDEFLKRASLGLWGAFCLFFFLEKKSKALEKNSGKYRRMSTVKNLMTKFWFVILYWVIWAFSICHPTWEHSLRLWLYLQVDQAISYLPCPCRTPRTNTLDWVYWVQHGRCISRPNAWWRV